MGTVSITEVVIFFRTFNIALVFTFVSLDALDSERHPFRI